MRCPKLKRRPTNAWLSNDTETSKRAALVALQLSRGRPTKARLQIEAETRRVRVLSRTPGVRQWTRFS